MNNEKNPEKTYCYNIFKEEIEKHLKNSPEYPLSIKIGNSRLVSLNAASLRDLNSVFSAYKDKLYDSNRTLLDFSENPNIINIDNAENGRNSINLNSLLSKKALDLIKSFNNSNYDSGYVVYKPFEDSINSRPGNPLPNFEILSCRDKMLDYKINPGFNIIGKNTPLIKQLSDELNYFVLMNSFLKEPILNPSFKYNWNPQNNVFKIYPQAADKNDVNFKFKKTPPRPKKQPHLLSALSRNENRIKR